MSFYTYMWLREDSTPYYVGKGSRARAFRKGSPPRERIILEQHAREEDAFEAECFLISFYGRKDNGTGILRNHTDGGEGVSGIEFSEETRVKMSASAKVKVFTEKHRSNMAIARIGYECTPEAIENMRIAGKRRDVSHLNTPDLISRRAATYRGSKLSQETRERQKAAAQRRRLIPVSEETKDKLKLAWIERKKKYALNRDASGCFIGSAA